MIDYFDPNKEHLYDSLPFITVPCCSISPLTQFNKHTGLINTAVTFVFGLLGVICVPMDYPDIVPPGSNVFRSAIFLERSPQDTTYQRPTQRQVCQSYPAEVYHQCWDALFDLWSSERTACWFSCIYLWFHDLWVSGTLHVDCCNQQVLTWYHRIQKLTAQPGCWVHTHTVQATSHCQASTLTDVYQACTAMTQAVGPHARILYKQICIGMQASALSYLHKHGQSIPSSDVSRIILDDWYFTMIFGFTDCLQYS